MDALDPIFDYMSQFDDAETDAERNYWLGYIDAYCDQNGINVAEAEEAHKSMQAWAAESLDSIAAKREP